MPLARRSDRIAEAPRRSDRREDASRLKRPGRLTRDQRFSIDEDKVPDGMVMEWKRTTLLGAQDRQNLVTCERNHWKPVTHDMQPHILGQFGKDGDLIEQDGLMLMMRPQYLNDDAEEEFNAMTADQTNQQLMSLKMKSREEVGPQRTKLVREYERTQAIE